MRRLVVWFLFFFLFVFLPGAADAQERQELFFAPLAEVLGYGHNSFACGGGLMLGYGTGGVLGLRLLYAMDNGDYIYMELQFLARYFLISSKAGTGPFVQLSAGPVLYSIDSPDISGYGSISAGLSAGWRFPLGNVFYIEPAIRGGYPYYYGAGVSTGIRW